MVEENETYDFRYTTDEIKSLISVVEFFLDEDPSQKGPVDIKWLETELEYLKSFV